MHLFTRKSAGVELILALVLTTIAIAVVLFLSPSSIAGVAK
jgi:hypothetical protein